MKKVSAALSNNQTRTNALMRKLIVAFVLFSISLTSGSRSWGQCALDLSCHFITNNATNNTGEPCVLVCEPVFCPDPQNYSYLWSNGVSCSAMGPATAGIYTVTVTYIPGGAGCTATVTLSSIGCSVAYNPCAPAQTWYYDGDGDGYYSQTQLASGSPGTGWSTLPGIGSGDCSDNLLSNPNAFYIHPGANEVCGNAKDDNCNGSTDEAGCCAAPAKPGTVTTTGGIAKVCPGQSRTYTVPSVAGITYKWIPATGSTINSGQGTNSVNITYNTGFTVSGTLSVFALNSCNAGPPRTLTVNRNNPAAVITTNGGPTTFCSGTNPLLLTASAGTGYTYQWKKGANNITGATNQTYVPTTTSANYKVVVTNTPGCSKTSAPISVTVNPLPAATITPQGSTTFCLGGSVALNGSTGFFFSYQWKKDGTNIIGATNVNYTATTAGVYKLKVTNANGCAKLSSGVTVSVPCREGINDSKFSVDVHPNPSSGDFIFDIQNSNSEKVSISIYDVSGRLIQSGLFTDSRYTIYDSQLSAGIYSAVIENGENKKILKVVKTE